MSLVEAFVVHEFPDASHPCVAAGARSGLALKAVGTTNQRVEITLDAHPTELLPAFDRVHRRPAVCIAVDEEDRACGEVE